MTKRVILASSVLRVFSKLYQGEFEDGWEAGEEVFKNFNDLDTLIRNLRPEGASPTERGWIFWRESIIRALEDVIGKLDIGNDEDAIIKSIICYTDQWRCEDTEQLPLRSAFEHPATCPIYIDARKSLLGWLKADFSIELSGIEETTLLTQFDRAIDDAVCRLWSKESPYFGQMVDQLSGPVAEGIGQRRQWDAHGLWMRDRFWRDPLWGQEKTQITLSDLYVPLRGYDRTPVEAKEGERFGHIKVYDARVFDMHSEIEYWLKIPQGSVRDRMRVIGGSPGSGKSSFARKLGADVSRWEDWRAIFVEVQGMSNTSDLHREIGERMVRRRKETGFEQNPLDMDEDRENLLLILDGLDELSKPGPEATAILTGFIRGLKELLNDKKSLRVIVLGRPQSAADALKESALPENHLLNVLWLAKVDHKRLRVNAENFNDPNELCKLDQRDEYWEKWCKVSGNFPNTCLLKNEKFGELNVEPVLAYLVLNYLENGGDPDNIRNRNDIYERVIRDLKPRRWGSYAHPGTEELSEDDFIFLLECLGLAAWANGGRIGDDNEFDRIRDHCSPDPEYYRDVDAATLQNVATQFYTHIQGGYEFIHKSFAEYLTARGLINFAKGRLLNDRNKLTSWLELTGGQEVDEQVYRFLMDEAKLCTPEDALQSKQLLEKLFKEAQQTGFPAHKMSTDNWRTAEARQRNAEIANLACLSAFVHRVMDTDLEAANWGFDLPNATTSMDLINRISKSQNHEMIALTWFNAVDMASQELVNANLTDASFRYANLSHTTLFGSRVFDTDFHGANLSSAHLDYMFSTRSEYSYANLTSATLSNSQLTDSLFRNAKLIAADLSMVNLSRADLTDANLTDANLTGANLSNANFFGAILTDANLSNASLTEKTMITQEQIESAKGNGDTKLPESLTHPTHWLDDKK